MPAAKVITGGPTRSLVRGIPWGPMGWYKVGDVAGLFAPGKKWRSLASIKDGTSNTVIVAERDAMGYKWGRFITSGTGEVRMGAGESVFCFGVCRHGPCGWGTNEGGQTRFANPDNTSAKALGLVPCGAALVHSDLPDRLGYQHRVAGCQQPAFRWRGERDQG